MIAFVGAAEITRSKTERLPGTFEQKNKIGGSKTFIILFRLRQDG